MALQNIFLFHSIPRTNTYSLINLPRSHSLYSSSTICIPTFIFKNKTLYFYLTWFGNKSNIYWWKHFIIKTLPSATHIWICVTNACRLRHRWLTNFIWGRPSHPLGLKGSWACLTWNPQWDLKLAFQLLNISPNYLLVSIIYIYLDFVVFNRLNIYSIH